MSDLVRNPKERFSEDTAHTPMKQLDFNILGVGASVTSSLPKMGYLNMVE